MSSTHTSPSTVRLISKASSNISWAASALGASIPVTVAVIMTVADQDLVSSSLPISLSKLLTSSTSARISLLSVSYLA